VAFRRFLEQRPLLTALLFEGSLIPLALLLALAAGVQPWTDLVPRASTGPLAVAATAVLLVLLAPAAIWRPPWLRAIEALVRPLVVALFRRHRVVGVLAVSALAGLGEELLVRGVLQAWLATGLGAWPAVVAAALAFGLAHALSPAYFVLATAMGLYLGALYQVTGDLALVSLVHALYDAVAIGYLLALQPSDTDAADADGQGPGWGGADAS
jgi:membrane protease YdiL (CAAX protease family)